MPVPTKEQKPVKRNMCQKQCQRTKKDKQGIYFSDKGKLQGQCPEK